jgi:transmembrane sensor
VIPPDDSTAPRLAPAEALDWPDRTGTTAAVLAAVARHTQARRRRRRRRLAAASLAVMALLGAAWLRPWHMDTPAPALAAPGLLVSPARQVLADGSTVELNGDSRIAVDYTPGVRRVRLLRGEAHFAVAHHPARPFVVVAGDVAVRAVGTAFAVRLAPADVRVLVTDGRIAVDRADTDPLPAPVRPLAFANRGAGVVVTPANLAPDAPAPAVTAVSAPEMAEQLAWRVPRLELNDTPLREAIALFNRHGRVRLELAAPALGDLRVSGVVRADNIPALLQLLRADYGVEAEPLGDRAFVLRRRR